MRPSGRTITSNWLAAAPEIAGGRHILNEVNGLGHVSGKTYQHVQLPVGGRDIQRCFRFAIEEFGEAVALLCAILEGGGELRALPYVKWTCLHRIALGYRNVNYCRG